VSPVELGAAATIVLAVGLCVLAVVGAAADAGRITAQRLRARAEARSGHGSAAGSAGTRARDAHAPRSRRSRVRRRG
jgi:hypothetical protein